MTSTDRTLSLPLQALACAFLARAIELETAPDMGRRHLRLVARCLSPDYRLELLHAIDDAAIAFPSEPAYEALYMAHERWISDNAQQATRCAA